jgi:hypothetical protein
METVTSRKKQFSIFPRNFTKVGHPGNPGLSVEIGISDASDKDGKYRIKVRVRKDRFKKTFKDIYLDDDISSSQ